MKKEVFLSEVKRIEKQIVELRNKRIELENSYINSNKEFNLEEKVLVEFKDRKEFGYIASINIGWNGELKYDIFKEKKDGNPSQHKLWLWGSEKIIKL